MSSNRPEKGKLHVRTRAGYHYGERAALTIVRNAAMTAAKSGVIESGSLAVILPGYFH